VSAPAYQEEVARVAEHMPVRLARASNRPLALVIVLFGALSVVEDRHVSAHHDW